MKKVISEFIERHKKLVDKFERSNVDTILKISEMICEALKGGGCVYLCGNGGSAADCQHIAGEFVGRFKRNRAPLPAVAFSTDTSVITCIGNDYSYNDIFTRQVEALVKKTDILWAFSTSGSSANVVAAAKLAKEKGAKVIGFTGKANSELEKISDQCLCSDVDWTNTAQEIHMLAYHIICELIERELMGITE